MKQNTRATYEAKAKQLVAGWDMATALKSTRYSMRAAGLWTMRRKLRAMLREAKRVRAKGETGEEMFPMRQQQCEVRMQGIEKHLVAIRDFENLDWAGYVEPPRRKQDNHKQKAATDAELVTFYEAAARSKYRTAFLVAEFSGARGEEFANGIRIEVGRNEKGARFMQFFIESAKCDGVKKGLELRSVIVPFPAKATTEVQRRWLDLAKLAATKRSHTCTVQPTAKKTVGQLVTGAFSDVSKAAGVGVAAYSLRHRSSAQAKQSNTGDAVAVAIALGHQTTDTQRHYGRSKRGGKDVSPVQIVAVKAKDYAIRSNGRRIGPRIHIKERVALGAAVRSAPPSVPRVRL